jgi:AraC-like DNA-binding protein
MEPVMPRTTSTPNAKGKAVAQRFKVLNTFIDFTMRELGRAALAVWLVLYRDTKDGIAQTSQADIARRAGLSERHVRRVVSRLVRVGLLVLVHRGGLRHGPSKYRVMALMREPC